MAPGGVPRNGPQPFWSHPLARKSLFAIPREWGQRSAGEAGPNSSGTRSRLSGREGTLRRSGSRSFSRELLSHVRLRHSQLPPPLLFFTFHAQDSPSGNREAAGFALAQISQYRRNVPLIGLGRLLGLGARVWLPRSLMQ